MKLQCDLESGKLLYLILIDFVINKKKRISIEAKIKNQSSHLVSMLFQKLINNK